MPNRDNAFFDSKVLSRAHAELWASGDGRACIKDIRSSNGTFVNGIRLSKENEESEVRELLPGDTLELGIDILNDENGTIVHRKVSARVDHAGPPNDSQERGYSNGLQRHLYENASTSSSVSLNSMPSQSQVGTGRHTITIDMVLKRLNNDLRVSKQVAADLKHTSEVFTKSIRNADSPFVQIANASSVDSASAGVNEQTSQGSVAESDLKDQLESRRQEFEARQERIQELESAILTERELRMESEDKLRQLETKVAMMEDAADDDDDTSSQSTEVRGTDEMSPENGNGTIERLENLLRATQEEVMRWRERTTIAESENTTKSSQILELVAALEKRNEGASTATIQDRALRGLGKVEGNVVSSLVSKGISGDAGDSIEKQRDDRANLHNGHATGSSTSGAGAGAGAATGVPNNKKGRGTAMLSAFAVVMLGVGLMSFMNEYGPKKEF